MEKHTIATIGSHSALDVCNGAKKEGFETLVIAQTGREKTYSKYYLSRRRQTQEVGCIDQVIVVDKFKDMLKEEHAKLMKKKNTIFVPNRSFAVYLGYENIEKNFPVPIFGNKYMLRAEEREEQKNQYYLMQKAKIKQPRKIASPQKIDCLVIVKAREAQRNYERAFFLANSYEDYLE